MRLIEHLYTEATALGVCDMFNGGESEERIFRLFTSPQGLEFCGKHSWPSLQQVGKFDSVKAKRAGIFIDAGDIELHNTRRAILIGHTKATLTYDDMAEIKHNVVVMYGASANINALNWAVVFAEYSVGGGVIDITKIDNAYVDVR